MPYFPACHNSKAPKLTQVRHFRCTVGRGEHPLISNKGTTTKVPGLIVHGGLNAHLPSVSTLHGVSAVNDFGPSAIQRTTHQAALLPIPGVSTEIRRPISFHQTEQSQTDRDRGSEHGARHNDPVCFWSQRKATSEPRFPEQQMVPSQRRIHRKGLNSWMGFLAMSNPIG